MKYTIDGFSLNKMLSVSSRSIVYQGIRNKDHLPVVLKIIAEDAYTQEHLAQLHHEYELIQSVSLKHTIKMHDLIQSSDYAVLVTEDIQGMALYNFLDKNCFSLQKKLEIAIKAIIALGELHAVGIVHKDINPRNMIWNPKTDQLKIIDFGIATRLSGEKFEITQPNSLEGSLAYLSPEQTGRINRHVDYRSDFYSYGVTLYELSTGHLPFAFQDPMKLIHAHIAKEAEPAHLVGVDVPEAFSAIIQKLLAKNAEDRYSSSLGIEADLKNCLNQLLETGDIRVFPLGKKDIPLRLEIPQKLYGRENELKQLQADFAAVAKGAKKITWITGYSGIGKTSLTQELYKNISQNSGYFLSDKFDQFQNNIPYSAFREIFKQWVNLILGESKESLTYWHDNLLQAFDEFGQVIINVIPDIELIIGPQSPVPELNSKEAQERFNYYFQKMMKVICQANHPMVLYLDDLQWADLASLTLLENLATDVHGQYVYIIGSYRDNEVDLTHPLQQLFNRLEKEEVTSKKLHLQGLTTASLSSLLEDTLKQPAKTLKPLVDLCYEKTQGNPFFLNQFLLELYKGKYLHFSPQKQSWQWDMETILNLHLTDNVIDLMSKKIKAFSKETQKLLAQAACIGNKFKLEMLACIALKSLAATAKLLQPVLEKGLILPLDGNYKFVKEKFEIGASYRFLHDMVQNAAYTFLNNQQKEQIHYKIAELLQESMLKNFTEKDVMIMANHYYCAKNFIKNKEKRIEMAGIFLSAGNQAKNANAFAPALNYYLTAIEFLPSTAWKTHYYLTYILHYEILSAYHLNSMIEEASQLGNFLFKKIKRNIDKAKLYSILTDIYYCQSDMFNANQAVVMALNLLGINISFSPEKNDLEDMRKKVSSELNKHNYAHLINLPALKDPIVLLMMKTIQKGFIPSHLAKPNLNELLVLHMIFLTLKHGNYIYASLAYLFYAKSLISSIPKDKKIELRARNYAKLGFKLLDKYPDKTISAQYHSTFGFFLQYRYYPIQECIKSFKIGNDYSLETGNLSLSVFAAHQLFITSLYAGKYLRDAKEAAIEALAYAKKNHESDITLGIMMSNYCTEILLGKLKPQDLREQIFEGRTIKDCMSDKRFIRADFFYYIYSGFCNYLLGDWAAALKNHEILERIMFSGTVTATIYWPLHQFYYPLTLLAAYSHFPQDIQKEKLKTIMTYNKIIKDFSALNPAFFQNKYLLVEAELERIKKNYISAIRYYLQSISAAKSQSFIHEEALANELLGRCYLELSDKKAAFIYLKNALLKYNLWGAKAKVQRMKKNYEMILNHKKVNNAPESFSLPSSSMDINESFDLMSIFKAAQSISKVIHFDMLLKQLLNIVIENSGANRAIILRNEAQNWKVEIEGRIENKQLNITINSIPLSEYEKIPKLFIDYIKRKKEPLILTGDSSKRLLTLDPYVQQGQPKSMMAMPVIYQNNVQFIIYLENTLLDNVFSPKRVQILQLLASQAAISLENSKLYTKSTHDPLTGLANRNLFYDTFQLYMLDKQCHEKKIAIIFCDLDYFKTINDTLGHEIGDKLLIYFSQQIKALLQSTNDLAVRLGGDEFILMVDGLNSKKDVEKIVKNFYKLLSEPVVIDGHKIKISSSVGISIYPEDGDTIQVLLKKADIALYRAKDQGKNRYQFYELEMEQTLNQVYSLEKELGLAFEKKEFRLYYQPVFSTNGKTILGLEVLLRWQHPKKGLLEASQFIEQLEKLPLMMALEEWIIETACKHLKDWEHQDIPIVPIMINVSVSQFNKRSLSQLTKKILENTSVDPSFLEYEISEMTLLNNNQRALDELQAIRDLGVSLSLDDFSTGYSSLAYLEKLPLNTLKIDRVFVKDNIINKSIVEFIIMLAHKLKLKVIVEGVETLEQRNYIHSMKADAIQGYFYSRPLSAHNCRKLLTDKKYKKIA